jgi:hypothetical protein
MHMFFKFKNVHISNLFLLITWGHLIQVEQSIFFISLTGQLRSTSSVMGDGLVVHKVKLQMNED